MTRKKVTLTYIVNDSERRVSYRKRKTGLIKKVTELSTLCGVEACAIIYSPYEQEPVVWPSRPGTLSVIERFHGLTEIEKNCSAFNQEDFTRQCIKKVDEKFARLAKENKNKEMENFMYQCIAGVNNMEILNFEDAASMSSVIDQIQREFKYRLEAMERCNLHQAFGSGSAFASGPALVVPGANMAAAPLNEVVMQPPSRVKPYPFNLNNFNIIIPTTFGAASGPGFDAD